MPKLELTTPALVVLTVIAEKELHGYDIEKVIWNRGFKFWMDLGKTSIYNALKTLEKKGLIESKLEQAGGPARKVYSITKVGRDCLRKYGEKILSTPPYPRNELDLGIYMLPFLGAKERVQHLEQGLRHLLSRRDFLKERLDWCLANKMDYPALNFERPLVAIEAEIDWLKVLLKKMKTNQVNLKSAGWEKYVYRDPSDETG